MGFGTPKLEYKKKSQKGQTHNPNALKQHNGGSVTKVTESGEAICEWSELIALAEQGFPIFCVDRHGAVLQRCKKTVTALENIGAWDDSHSQERILPVWNWWLWNHVPEGNSVPAQIVTICPCPEYTCTGAVLWSPKNPDILNVCLVSLDEVGLSVDPLWRQLLSAISSSGVAIDP